jgi:hypothetical protein
MKRERVPRMARGLLSGAAFVVLLLSSPTLAQHSIGSHAESAGVAGSDHDRQHGGSSPTAWEGSAKGIAYSERNHHIAGLMVMLMGLAEVSHVMRLSSLAWARLLLPSAMLFAGLFVMIWSDHEAWPIGKLSFAETFISDPEIIQHKVYGILALTVGSVELFRRLGHVDHRAWASPLPLMAIIGGLMLFGHSHGDHPAAHKIAMHHAVMGTMAVTAGSSKLFSTWANPLREEVFARWEWLWAGLLLLIGAQLLIYSE